MGGLSSGTSETIDTFTFRYPTVDICTTSVSYIIMYNLCDVNCVSILILPTVSVYNDHRYFKQSFAT